MTYLTVDELIQHCNKTLNRLPSGTPGYQEHESVRYYLQQLRHYQNLNVPYPMLEELADSAVNGKLQPVECGVGKSVWYIHDDCSVEKYAVEHIDIWESGATYYCKNDDGSYAFDDDEFGSHAFLTEEEAKAAAGKRLMG